MTTADLERTARALIADGKGILAADETPQTLTKRFAAVGINSTPETRGAYREMFFTTPGAAEFISGVILQDETFRQQTRSGESMVDTLVQRSIIPGIKVDMGVKPLAGRPEEDITEGLDGLRDRLKEYHQKGASFAKWRAVIHIGEGLPSAASVHANVHALARYAALCQEQDLVPVVEPEVLMDGSHTIQRCEQVTASVLQATMNALYEQRVKFEGMLLKPNMILPAKQSQKQAGTEEVARATVRCMRRHVPVAIPGIVFLSGGQDYVTATERLNAINRLEGPKPWKLTFSFARALQDEALHAWEGAPENVPLGQRAFLHRARCVSAAALGKYRATMEGELAA